MHKIKVLVARLLATSLVVLAIALAAEAQINCGGIYWISPYGCALLKNSDKGRDPNCVLVLCQASSGSCKSASGQSFLFEALDLLPSNYCDCVKTSSGQCNDGATNLCGQRVYYANAGCTLQYCPLNAFYTCGCVMDGC